MKKVIQGGTIINEGRQFQADLVIEGGKITQILAQAPETLLQEAQVIDASHCFVIPGVIDDQVHFREPGLTHKGNIGEGSRAAAAGGVKGDDGLARKVVAFEERLDDARGLIPPDGKAHEHRVVLRHIRDLARDGGAALGVLHLDGAAALFIHPVKVLGRVGRDGFDLKKVRAGHGRERFCELRGHAAGGKISNQCFRHVNSS